MEGVALQLYQFNHQSAYKFLLWSKNLPQISLLLRTKVMGNYYFLTLHSNMIMERFCIGILEAYTCWPYLPYSSHHQKNCKESVVSSWFNGAYSIITNKDDLTKENTRINQGLKKDRYQEKNVKSLRELLTIPACLSQLKSHRLCWRNSNKTLYLPWQFPWQSSEVTFAMLFYLINHYKTIINCAAKPVNNSK